MCAQGKVAKTVFYDIFNELCKLKGVSDNKACIEIGLSRTAVAKWKSGGTPNGVSASKIANYFDVSVDYLLGNEKKPTAEISNEQVKDEFVAFYGDVKKELTQGDLDDIKKLMQLRAELNRNV